MSTSFILISVAAATISGLIWIYKNHQYKKTTYYQITKNPYWLLDKGTYGEYLIYKELRSFEERGGKILFNIFIPKINGGTTEIDALLITSRGLFVFESKNYNGWIFGNEAHKHWTQTFPSGRGRCHKERFYNPIIQNASHITHLRPIIGKNTPVWSIIVFSDNCTLKDITIRSKKVHVINRHETLPMVVRLYEETQTDFLTDLDINNLYNKIYPYTQVDNQIREQHAEKIKRKTPYQ